jgi:hypothetical protein
MKTVLKRILNPSPLKRHSPRLSLSPSVVIGEHSGAGSLQKVENCDFVDFFNYKLISDFIFAFFHSVILAPSYRKRNKTYAFSSLSFA